MELKFPNLTVTFLIEYQDKFLLISRSNDEVNFPSLWAFPGGKVEIGETIIQTIKREVFEETGLILRDECSFLDSYFFKNSVGVAFLVRARNNMVTPSEEIQDYTWVNSLEELRNYKCIPGIYNHLQRALKVLNNGHLDSLEEMNLVPDKYLNS